MQIGAVITDGVRDWQIVQQENGVGELAVSGTYCVDDEMEKTSEFKEVYVRIVDENTADTVIPWRKAYHFGEDKWECRIASVPAGGLYRIETCLKLRDDMPLEWAIRGDMVHHVGVGNLFVIAGQSNSAGYAKDSVYDPPELGVHVLKNDDQWNIAAHPLNDSTQTKHIVSRDPNNTGHSPYLSFAKFVKRKTGHPVGLIPCALGGSPLERWNPDEIGDLYQNMVGRIKNIGAIKGVLWYQGCTDALTGRETDYKERFLNMVSHLRQDLNDAKFPIFTYQLGRYTEKTDLGSDESWSVLREAQRQAGKEEGIYVLPTMDSTLSDAIHNSAPFNMVLGERMAKLVLHVLFEQFYFAYAPDIKEGTVCDDTSITLVFDHIYDKLEMFGVAPEDLPLLIEDHAGKNGIREYRVVSNDSVWLKLERPIGKECFVSGCFGKNPQKQIPVDYANHYPILAFHRVNVN